MPTIDQLAPAGSAADSDEFVVSQGGITRKIARSQVLNGYQDEIVLSPQSLLGRVSSGVGAPEVIAIGTNLTFNGTTLSATASPFVVSQLPSGVVPGAADLLPVSQGGTTVAVSYSQLLSGFNRVSNVDLSGGLVTPAGSSTAQTLASLTGGLLSKEGGSLTGALVLAASPTTGLQAATKGYVDSWYLRALPLAGGSMTGQLLLAGAPTQDLNAATKSYVDSTVSGRLPVAGGSLTGALYLKADPTVALGAATKSYADLKLARTGDTLTGALILAADPVTAQQAATKSYVDSQVSASLSKSGGTLSGGLFLAGDPSVAAQAATKQYVDQRLLRSGDTLSGPLSLAADPSAASQAATKNYVDVQVGASLARTGGSMTGPLSLAADPAAPLHASTKQYADLKVARAGDTLTGALSLAADPTAPLHATTKQYVDGRLSTVLTTAGCSFVGAVGLAADPVTAMQATTKQYTDRRILRTGDTMTGPLVLASDPVASAGAATKSYVDAALLAALPLAGGTMSGNLMLAADPTAAGQAATKRYVDAQIPSGLPLTGGSLTGALSLAGVPSQPAHASNKQYVDAQVATALPLAGGSLKGALLLAGDPTLALHAATKRYVDSNPNAFKVINITMPPYSAALDGVTDDTAAFKAAYQAASAGSAIYVPFGVTKLQQPGSWGVALTKKVKWLVDGTTLTDGTPLASAVPYGAITANLMLPGLVVGNTLNGFSVSQSGSAATDLAVSQSNYVVTHNGGTSGVIANQRTDTIIVSSPANFVWGGLDRLLWAGGQVPSGFSTAQHVGRYVQTLRLCANRDANGSYVTQPQMWAACLEFRDATGLPSSSTAASLTIEMDWYGNGADDASNRQIQSLVVGQANTSGLPVEVGTVIGVYLAGGSSGSVKNVFAIGIPFSNAVLDTRAATSVSSAPVIRMAAGQAIAFEGTATNRLWYDGTYGVLRWSNGLYNNVVGKGISVGFQSVFSTSITVPSYMVGNICFLTPASPITITLPAASSIPAGTGYTFTNIGTSTAAIVPGSGNSIDCGSVILQPNDRYHVISDNSGTWREVFRTNAVNPKWTAPPTLPSYTVASLPSGCSAGAVAFASNGRKPSEVAGSGTGVQVYFDGTRWISASSGTAVAS